MWVKKMNVSYRLVLILGQTFLEVSKALCGSLKPCKKTTFDIFTHPIIYIYMECNECPNEYISNDNIKKIRKVLYEH